MALTQLFNKLKRTPQSAVESYFAIQIDSEFVKTAIWTVNDQMTEIVALGSTSEWDGSSTQVLIEAVDSSLSIALEHFETKQEPDKVIFGLPETWVTPEGVAHPRLIDLKAICEKLGLKPLGFVVTTEAITQYLRAKEGTPPTAILLRVSASEVAVTTVMLGHIEGTHVAGRSDDLAADVHEGLARFGERDSLPSRILLYNGGEDLQDLSQQLLSYDWQSHLPFLHIPTIEPLDSTFSITAIAVSGGSEVAKSLGFTIIEMKTALDVVQEPEVTMEAPPSEIPNETPGTSMREPESEITPEEAPTFPRRSPSGNARTLLLAISSRVKKVWNVMTGMVPRVRLSLPRFQNSFFSRHVLRTGTFIVALLSLLIVMVIQVAKRVPRASVSITLTGQTLSERVTISIVDHADIIDPAKGMVRAETVMVEKSGKVSAETTGTATVGEHAKGNVKLFNKTNAVKTFPVGTTITALGKKFTIDTEMTIASQSAQDTGITFGTSTNSVSAAAFGPEYNLDAGTTFDVANLSPSAFSAKNDSAFSGGTKRETKVVTKKDRQDLLKRVVDDLTGQTKSEIEAQSKGRIVLEETISVDVAEQTFSAEVGEEADDLSLVFDADVTALAIDEIEFRSLLSAMLASSVPDGFRILPDRLAPTIESVEKRDDGLTVGVIVQAPLSPVVDERTIKNRLKGKRPAVAAEQVKTLPYFHKMDISLSPSFPPILRWIPLSENQITLDVTIEP